MADDTQIAVQANESPVAESRNNQTQAIESRQNLDSALDHIQIKTARIVFWEQRGTYIMGLLFFLFGTMDAILDVFPFIDAAALFTFATTLLTVAPAVGKISRKKKEDDENG